MSAERERGAVLVLTSFLLFALLVITSLVLDLGNASQRRSQAQAAVDNAAMGAAMALPAPSAVPVAAQVAARNVGLSDFGSGTSCATADRCYSATGWELEVTTPYQGSSSQMRLRLCRAVPSVFGLLVDRSTWTVCANASSRARSSSVGADIVVLQATGDKTFTCSGSCAVTTNRVSVHSTGVKGLSVSGSGRITAESIGVGAIAPNGVDKPSNVTCGGASYYTASCPQTSQTAETDPYATLVPPTRAEVEAAYGYGSCTSSGGTIACTPGVHASTLTVSGGTPATFAAGIYYLEDGMTVSGGSPISGSGVFFYNAGSKSKFTVSGGSSISMSPLGDGSPYSHIIVMQNRINKETLTFSGGSSIIAPGTLYNPAGTTVYSGGSNTDEGIGQIVTNKLTVSGSSYIGTINGGGAGNPTIELYE